MKISTNNADVHDNFERVANALVKEIFLGRRLLLGELEKAESFHLEAEPHFNKIMKAIMANRPLNLILPAFPAKSPSRLKTLSHFPDYGEEVAFLNLHKLCEKLENIYKPGITLTICSDGRVFSDIVKITDQAVTDYGREIRRKVKDLNISHINFFDLDDVYPEIKDYSMLREELMISHGESLFSLRSRCKIEKHTEEMYRGITKFLFEDFCGIDDFKRSSKNEIQNLARLSAYRVIQRSNAWSRLLLDKFPDSVRLSIHPQFRVSEKIGVNLIGLNDFWKTPWHSVVLKMGDEVLMTSRCEAERMNASLIFKDGRPSHFEIPTV